MRGRTFALSQKELQRVSVISSCAKGDMACARAAELLSLSIRHVRRLKKRMREQGEAALAHANRGRPSPRRLPSRVRRDVFLQLARTTYVGFNDHHLCEKLCEVEGFSLSRETLRRLLRQSVLGSPRQRRAPAHRQRRLRSAREGELVQLDGSPHDWLEGRGPRLTALGLQDDATGKILAAQFFPSRIRTWLSHSAGPTAPPPRHTAGFLWRSQRHLRAQRRLLVAPRTARRKTSAHPVRPRPRSTRHHLHRCPQSASQRPRRTSLGGAPGSLMQRAAPRSGCRSGLRQRRASSLPRRLQPPLRPPASRYANRLAAGTGKSRPHLLLRP